MNTLYIEQLLKESGNTKNRYTYVVNLNSLPFNSTCKVSQETLIKETLNYIMPLFNKICHFPQTSLRELRKTFRAAKVREHC